VGGPGCDRTRTRDDAVTAVAAILAATANLQNPNDVNVSRPSDALAAKQATDTTLTALLLGLGAVALLVGGVGVANTMVISVLERRPGIGLRRGDLDQLRARADAGDVAAAVRLAVLLGSGRRGLDRLRARADAGDRDAARQLAGLLADRGDLDQAEQLLRAGADAGDGAADLLADLLTKQCRGEEAERLRRFGLNPDGSIACA
jgi:hypothetical protein